MQHPSPLPVWKLNPPPLSHLAHTHSLNLSHLNHIVPSGARAHCSALFTFTALLNDSSSVDLPRTQPVSCLSAAFFPQRVSFVPPWMKSEEEEEEGGRKKKLALAGDWRCVKGPRLNHVLRRISAPLRLIYSGETHLHLHLPGCEWRVEGQATACFWARGAKKTQKTCANRTGPHKLAGCCPRVSDFYNVSLTAEIRRRLSGSHHQPGHHFLRTGEEKEAALCGEERPLQRPAR